MPTTLPPNTSTPDTESPDTGSPDTETLDISSPCGTGSPPPAKRKRGAQPGNKNSIKHGFYSIQPEVLLRLSTHLKGEGADEIDLLRSIVDKTASTFNANPNPTLEQCQTTLRGISQAIDTIKGLHLMQKIVYSNQTSIEKAIEELSRLLPPEQD